MVSDLHAQRMRIADRLKAWIAEVDTEINAAICGAETLTRHELRELFDERAEYCTRLEHLGINPDKKYPMPVWLRDTN